MNFGTGIEANGGVLPPGNVSKTVQFEGVSLADLLPTPRNQQKGIAKNGDGCHRA